MTMVAVGFSPTVPQANIRQSLCYNALVETPFRNSMLQPKTPYCSC